MEIGQRSKNAADVRSKLLCIDKRQSISRKHAETSCPMTRNQGLLPFGPHWPHDKMEFATSTPKGDGITGSMDQNSLTNTK